MRLDHDMSLTVQATSNTRFSDSLRCISSCSFEPPCYPIRVPDDDHYREERGSCIEFVRSAAICLSGETSFLHLPYRREQINSLTSFFDASNIYGSTVQDAWDLRERSAGRGLLRIHRYIIIVIYRQNTNYSMKLSFFLYYNIVHHNFLKVYYPSAPIPQLIVNVIDKLLKSAVFSLEVI